MSTGRGLDWLYTNRTKFSGRQGLHLQIWLTEILDQFVDIGAGLGLLLILSGPICARVGLPCGHCHRPAQISLELDVPPYLVSKYTLGDRLRFVVLSLKSRNSFAGRTYRKVLSEISTPVIEIEFASARTGV